MFSVPTTTGELRFAFHHKPATNGSLEKTECFVTDTSTDTKIAETSCSRYMKDHPNRNTARKAALKKILTQLWDGPENRDFRTLVWHSYHAKRNKY